MDRKILIVDDEADIRFLRIALIPVALHLVWNTSWLASFGLLRFLILGIIAWAVALRLVQAGLQQIREEKCACNRIS